MPRRFTDSEKWRDPWFSVLPTELKVLWMYVLDNCNHAGIWKVNVRMAEFEMGVAPPWGERQGRVPAEFNDRVFSDPITGSYWFIPKFMTYQYGRKLNSGDAVFSALKEVDSKGFKAVLESVIGESLEGLQTPKAKAKAIKEGEYEGKQKRLPKLPTASDLKKRGLV